MEFMAWFSHKYIMHGFLWSLHKDHHNQNLKTSWWERNDLFFVFYAVVSMLFFYSQVELGFKFGFAIGFGIWLMDSLISWFTIFLYTNVLNFKKNE